VPVAEGRAAGAPRSLLAVADTQERDDPGGKGPNPAVLTGRAGGFSSTGGLWRSMAFRLKPADSSSGTSACLAYRCHGPAVDRQSGASVDGLAAFVGIACSRDDGTNPANGARRGVMCWAGRGDGA